jgi:hypothetical protein
VSLNWKIAFVCRLPDFSASRKKSEYEDKDETEEFDEIESGDDERDLSEAAELDTLLRGNRTAMVPPKVGLLDSPHILSKRARCENGKNANTRLREIKNEERC